MVDCHREFSAIAALLEALRQRRAILGVEEVGIDAGGQQLERADRGYTGRLVDQCHLDRVRPDHAGVDKGVGIGTDNGVQCANQIL